MFGESFSLKLQPTAKEDTDSNVDADCKWTAFDNLEDILGKPV